MEYSAGAVVFRKSGRKREYLLLLYNKGHWEFPKGHLEEGETELQTLRRELREETGITRFRRVAAFREQIKYRFTGKRKKKSKLVTFYLVEALTKNVKLSDEHMAFAWMSFKAALHLVTYVNAKSVLRKAERMLTR